MSAAAGIGASIGTNGMSFGFTASASLARGKEDGEGTTQLNTHVTAGQALTIESGGDTNIKGAVASGDQVVANVGGNLNIESLQDTAKFDSKHQSLSASGTVGMGASVSASFSNSSVHSDYASVQEQSGIRAGAGGFQIEVNGNTDLKGGLIAGAADPGKNILSTGTLTTSDLKNVSAVDASSSGLGFATSSGDKPVGKYEIGKALFTNGMNNGSDSKAAEGSTMSTIADGVIAIRDSAAQQELTGKSALATIDGLNRSVSDSNRAVARPDIEHIEANVLVEQAFKNILAGKLTEQADHAYHQMFETDNQVYRVTCSATPAECLKNPKLVETVKIDHQTAIDEGNIIAVNGIMNELGRAGQLAYQNAPATEIGSKPDKIVLMHIPPADSGFAEVLVAGYEKMLAPIFGYTNADRDYAQLIRDRGGNATISLGHSRGTIVQVNAMDILHEAKFTNKDLSVMGVGGGVLAQSYFSAANSVNTYSQTKNDTAKISYVYMSNDPVPVIAGFNGFFGNGNIFTSAAEFVNVWFKSNSAHSCYGSGATGCVTIPDLYPGGPQPSAPGSDKVIRYTDGVRVSEEKK